MKSTAVDESLSSMNQQFCSRENQLLQLIYEICVKIFLCVFAGCSISFHLVPSDEVMGNGKDSPNMIYIRNLMSFSIILSRLGNLHIRKPGLVITAVPLSQPKYKQV